MIAAPRTHESNAKLTDALGPGIGHRRWRRAGAAPRRLPRSGAPRRREVAVRTPAVEVDELVGAAPWLDPRVPQLDLSRGLAFSTYAVLRIRGAILTTSEAATDAALDTNEERRLGTVVADCRPTRPPAAGVLQVARARHRRSQRLITRALPPRPARRHRHPPRRTVWLNHQSPSMLNGGHWCGRGLAARGG